MSARRRVLIANHFAAPLGEPGGTRHVELAERLEHWDAVVLAADRNLLDGRRRTARPPGFEVVRVPGHSGNGPARVAGWLAYAAGVGRAARRLGPFDAVVGSSPHLPAAVGAPRGAARHRERSRALPAGRKPGGLPPVPRETPASGRPRRGRPPAGRCP